MHSSFLKSTAARVAVSGVLVLLTGCGGEDSDSLGTVDVSGMVTLNGEPLCDAEVYFMTDLHTGYGRTDAAGRFELVQGAAPGQNNVIITKVEGAEGVVLDPESGMDLQQLQAAARGAADPRTGQLPDGIVLPEEVIPSEYSDPEQSKLIFNVPESGSESADFRL